MRSSVLAFALFTPLWIGCAELDTTTDEDLETDEVETTSQEISGAVQHGRDVWFDNTYGGEKFFTFLKNHPDPSKRIDIGFQAVVDTPRATRFDVWGVINDPDCEANPAGGADICPEGSSSSGIVGIKRFPGPGGTWQYGTTCASCHAGFDPLHPPDDPNEPEWSNIHATIGNGYVDFGAIFSVNLPPTDVRRLMFDAWPNGSVDTTLLFNDGIMNPGVVTHFWEHKHRPTFEVGMDEPQMRNGQAGDDDVGRGLAALRVYSNIGVCFMECALPAVLTNSEVDIATCEANCPDWPPAEDIEDLGAFLSTHDAPQYPGWSEPLTSHYGRQVFDANCRSCHERQGDLKFVLSNDEVNSLVSSGVNATNACRAKTTNWLAGRIWGQFSSQVYKDRFAAGQNGYRTMPLSGIWATTPFLHNQSIGTAPPADAAPWERAAHYWDAMWELLSANRTPKVDVTPIPIGPFPAGTPLRFIFSTPNPATGQALCMDFVENRGHYYGSNLSAIQKVALIYWLQYQ